MSRDCIVLWSLLVTTACFTEPPTTAETSDATTSDDTSTSAAETAGSAETAGTDSDEGTTSGGTGSTSASSTSEASSSSGGDSSTGAVSEVLFDFYDGACVALWEVTEAIDFEDGACGLMPMDTNEAGGAWRFPTLMTMMTMMGEQERVLVLQPPPLDAAVVRGTFSAADVVPEPGAVLEFDYAFVSVMPGAPSVGTMTFHAYVQRPDGITTDILLEEALGDGTLGNLGIPLDTVVFGDLDNIVLEVRSDTYVEGQAVALWGMRVIAET